MTTWFIYTGHDRNFKKEVLLFSLERRDGAVMIALASHQWSARSICILGVTCGLNLLVFYSAPSGISPGTPVFPSPQKPSSDSIERVSIECRKTKTKVITLANQKRGRQSSKPIKTRSNYTQPTESAGKCAHPSHDLVLVSLLIG